MQHAGHDYGLVLDRIKHPIGIRLKADLTEGCIADSRTE